MDDILKKMADVVAQMNLLKEMAAETAEETLCATKKRHKEELESLSTDYRVLYEQKIAEQAEEITNITQMMHLVGLSVKKSRKISNLEKPLLEVIADILNSSGRKMKTSEVYLRIKNDYAWTGSYGYVASTLCKHAGKSWQRVARGKYAPLRTTYRSPLVSKLTRAQKSRVVKHTMTIRDMIVEAIGKARNGEPVRRKEIRDYIENKWNHRFNYSSITPRIYGRMIPNGTIILAGPGLFKVRNSQ